MPRIDATANAPPIQPTADGGHANHGATAGASFADALSQAIGQPAAASPHGNHGGGASGSSQHGGHGGGLTSPSSDPHPQHVPLTSQAHGGKKHGVQEVALGVRAYRQQLIAANIANADTPGYKAVDIDFQEALRNAQAAANVPPVSLTTTSGGHLSGQSTGTQPPIPLKYHVPSQGSIDGNTVEMDVERAKFAENTVMHQFAMDRVSGHFKHEIEMLQSLK